MRRLAFILILLCSLETYAGHLIGGEIFYECLGDGRYAIGLTMYRDCYATGQNVVTSFDNFVRISIYEALTNQLDTVLIVTKPQDSTRIPLVLNVPCMEDPPDLCVVGMTYRDTIDLDVPEGGLLLINQRCCRTPDALNIVNPSTIGSTYMATIPDSSVAPCNSSPKFNQVPPIALCTGIYLDLDYSATDPDGDSLVYSMCAPYRGGAAVQGSPAPATPSPPPFGVVPWDPGFNESYQVPSAPTFQVDSVTGIITGRPNQVGTYVFAVRVEEYRNGVLIGENRRDFQMSTVFCEIEAAAAIDSLVEECVGLEVQFYNISTLGKNFEWDFGDTTTLADTSSVLNPTYTFPDTGVYTIMLTAFGDLCADTAYLEYYVRPRLEPKFTSPDPQCLDINKFQLFAEGYFDETTEIRWSLRDIPIAPEADTQLIGDTTDFFRSLEAGTFPVHVKYSDYGCDKFYSDSITIIPNPLLEIDIDLNEDCVPFESSLFSYPELADKPSFRWAYLGDTISGDTVSIFTDTIGEFDLWVELRTDSGCVDTISQYYERYVIGLDTPSAYFYATPIMADMYEPYFEVFDQSLKAEKVEFTLNDSAVFNLRYFQLDLPDTGYHDIRLLVTHENGCQDSAFSRIRTEPRYLFFAPNAFTPDDFGGNESWQAFVYDWHEFEIQVYNRWGEIVYESDNPDEGWNGQKFNRGKDCPVGTYSYNAFVKTRKQKEFHYNGVIHLIR